MITMKIFTQNNMIFTYFYLCCLIKFFEKCINYGLQCKKDLMLYLTYYSNKMLKSNTQKLYSTPFFYAKINIILILFQRSTDNYIKQR